VKTAVQTKSEHSGLRDWLANQLAYEGPLETIAGDAGTRAYYRLTELKPERVVMVAPDQPQACQAYLKVGELLAQAGLHVPRVEAVDLNAGFMLLEDLGRVDYLAALSGAQAPALMDSAIDALVRWQAATQPDVLAHYNAERLRAELDLFPSWYVQQHLGLQPDAHWYARWSRGCEQLIAAACAQPQVWVHRDFMARNLMVSDPNPGIIDFQDALTGPVTYDLVSLLRDAFMSFSAADEARWIDRYQHRALAAGIALPADLPRAMDWMGAQRHLKVLGIFARLRYRDQKPRYLDDAPRFWGYLRRELGAYAELADFAALLDDLPAPSA